MENYKEQPKFEIQPVIEQKPFEDPAVQSFFTKWCEINDFIKPQMVSREDWEQKSAKGIIEKGFGGKRTLYIPEDLQLWEIVGVLEAVDHDTFISKPERRDEAKREILELGKTFQSAGTYIAQRLESIPQGKGIASALAEEFYSYGQSLRGGKKSEKLPTIDDIASHNLSAEEIETVDRFLAGGDLYRSRQARAEKALIDSGQVSKTDSARRGEFYETERCKTLAQFFRVSEKAFELEAENEKGKKRQGDLYLRSWQEDLPIHSAFIAKVEKAMAQKIETPKRELESAIFRRGLENLVKEMRVKERGWKKNIDDFFKEFGINLRLERKKLIDDLDIKRLKSELKDIKKSGDARKISVKEREIADIIQSAVSSFPYGPIRNNPSEIIANQFINCLGASMLGGALMQEAGLNYLAGAVPEHSILFLVTSDGHVEWRDMRDIPLNEDLTDEEIKGNKKDGSPITVADIVEFSKKPSPEGLRFDIADASEKYDEKCKDKLFWVKKGQRRFVSVFEPEYGQKIQLLNNTGNILSDLGYDKEAVEAYRQTIATDPKNPYPYYGLGRAFHNLGRIKEAIEAYRRAIAVDPKYITSYIGLGDMLFDSDRNEEAIETYRQAIAINPERAITYHKMGVVLQFLNRKEEAVEAYQKFIDLADKKEDNSLIERDKKKIAELKNK